MRKSALTHRLPPTLGGWTIPRVDLTRPLNAIAGQFPFIGGVPLSERRPSEADEFLRLAFGNHPLLHDVGERLKPVLLELNGAAIVRLARSSEVTLTLQNLQLVVCHALGFNANCHSENQPDQALFAISPLPTPRYFGNGENANSIGPHTDGSGVGMTIDVLALGCIDPAPGSGGQTLVVDAVSAVLSLSKSDRQLLAEKWPRTNPYDEHALPAGYVRKPIAAFGDAFEFSYHPDRVRQGLDRCGESSPRHFQTLANLDAALWRHAHPVLLKRGELLLINNRRLGHGRIGFEHDRARPRRLEREWIVWRAKHEDQLQIQRVQ